jgi:hypothetical protein
MKRAMSFDGRFAPFRFLLLEPEPDVTLDVVASDAVNGDALALMMLKRCGSDLSSGTAPVQADAVMMRATGGAN